MIDPVNKETSVFLRWLESKSPTIEQAKIANKAVEELADVLSPQQTVSQQVPHPAAAHKQLSEPPLPKPEEKKATAALKAAQKAAALKAAKEEAAYKETEKTSDSSVTRLLSTFNKYGNHGAEAGQFIGKYASYAATIGAVAFFFANPISTSAILFGGGVFIITRPMLPVILGTVGYASVGSCGVIKEFCVGVSDRISKVPNIVNKN